MYIKKGNKIYKVEKEIDIEEAKQEINSQLGNLEEKREAKIYQINSAFDIKKTKLENKLKEINNT